MQSKLIVEFTGKDIRDCLVEKARAAMPDKGLSSGSVTIEVKDGKAEGVVTFQSTK